METNLDKTRITKLNHSSGKFIPKKKKKSIIDPFVERTKKTRNQRGKKVSGGIVETRSQMASEDENTRLELEIHQNPILD